MGGTLILPTETPVPTGAQQMGEKRSIIGRWFWTAVILVILIGVGGTAYYLGLIQLPNFEAGKSSPATGSEPMHLKVELVKDPENPKEPTHTLQVPEEVRKSLNIRRKGLDGKWFDILAETNRPKDTRPLIIPGSTNFDPAYVHRIRALCTC